MGIGEFKALPVVKEFPAICRVHVSDLRHYLLKVHDKSSPLTIVTVGRPR